MEIVEDDDGVVATIPDLPGCASFGDTIETAVRNLAETKELWIKGRIDGGFPVPEPTQIEDFSGKFVLRIPRSLHRSLDREAQKQGVSLNQYILHLLSERHAVTKIEQMVEEVGPSFSHLNHCYEHRQDLWGNPPEILRFSITTGPTQTLDSSESLLGMLEFLPKSKASRGALYSHKDLKDPRAMYEGKL